MKIEPVIQIINSGDSIIITAHTTFTDFRTSMKLVNLLVDFLKEQKAIEEGTGVTLVVTLDTAIKRRVEDAK